MERCWALLFVKQFVRLWLEENVLPIEEFKLKIYIICIFVGNENAEQSSSTIPCREEYFQKK